MTTTKLHQRILRRELHSPRSALAIILSIIAILLCVYVGIEIVLMMLGKSALLLAPPRVDSLVPTIENAPMALLLGVGIVLAVFGVVLLIAAIAPGRRPRHQLPAARATVVADDTVIASALAKTASHTANTHPDHSVVRVSKKRAAVDLTPTSGIPVQRDAVSAAVQEQLDTFEIRPPLELSVVVDSTGKVGK